MVNLPMNRNVVSIWEKFQKECEDMKKFEDFVNLFEEVYDVTPMEVVEMNFIAQAKVDDKFTAKAIEKMKKKEPELYKVMTDLYVEGILFGVVFSDYLK
jgi:hypothetical protein